MFESFENSYQIMEDCMSALSKDKELLIFPVLSGLALSAVVGSFVLPLTGTSYLPLVNGTAEGGGLDAQALKDPVVWVLLFAFYFATTFTMTFFNSALIACAVVRFHDGNPNVLTGLRFACHRLPQIIAWSLFSATIGVLLRVLESERNVGARIVAALFGLAWSVATYFVVPAIVVEKVGPIQALRKSMGAMRETWGELLVMGFSLGPMQFLIMLVAAIPVFVGGYFGGSFVLPALLTTAGLWLLIILFFATLNGYLVAALYLYATQAQVPEGFDEGFMRSAFVPKEA